ncbi:MAG: cation diffusion facilitator family transporter [Bacteroidales bacterium]|nr:cation diffusion facilitator family transporter [Bacteroidales bacterium]
MMDNPTIQHSPDPHNPSGRLLLSIVLNAMITLVEIAGGILSNSLALISDAIHNLSDTLALTLAWFANKFGKHKPDARRTYGYQRIEILSAFVNASALTAVSIYLIYESVVRFLNPEPVKSGLMLIIAIFGLFANMISMLFLHRDSKNTLNVKAAYLHLLGDTLSSVIVVVGAIIIHYTNFLWLDPALTFLISIVIIRQAYKILRDSVDILMQSTPTHLNLQEIKNFLEKHPMISNVHHIHCWQLQDSKVHFEAHIETYSDIKLSESGKLIAEIKTLLRDQFKIGHITLQIEYNICEDKDMIKIP